eukprot:7376911-Prymnesium_polylepis.1
MATPLPDARGAPPATTNLLRARSLSCGVLKSTDLASFALVRAGGASRRVGRNCRWHPAKCQCRRARASVPPHRAAVGARLWAWVGC